MNAIDILEELVRKFEGCKLKSYKCPAGVWTIGYGHTEGVKSGDTWSQQYADAVLRQDCQKRLDMSLQASPSLKNATSGQQAAIADFIFNVGIGNYNTSTLKKNIDAGDFSTARRVSIHLWNKATDPKTKKKVVLKGLVKRRQAEADLM